MADIIQQNTESIWGASPSRIAWGVMLVGFVIFLFICVSSTIGLQYFFFQSSTPMQTTLQVGRGTTIVIESGNTGAATGTRPVSRDTVIRTDTTDTLDQATLSFRGINQTEGIIAAATLKGGATLRFGSATQPRFEWSTPIYLIELRDLSGQVEIVIPENLERLIEVRIRTLDNTEARLRNSGRYEVEATPTQISVVNRGGEAIMIAPDRQTTRSIPTGQRGVLRVGEPEIILADILQNLLTNSELTTLQVEGSASEQVIGWRCFTSPEELLPRGNWRTAVSPDGRESLHIVRRDGATNSGETRCEQSLGEADFGLDVSQYDYLSLRVTVYIDEQSLNLCGTQASECPLMMRVRYWAPEGSLQGIVEWVHGIYARNEPVPDYRERCDSCWEDHIRVYEDGWYTYESGNLFEIIPQGIRPQAITEVIFYGAGHQYDLYIDEIALMAGHTAELAVDENGNVLSSDQ